MWAQNFVLNVVLNNNYGMKKNIYPIIILAISLILAMLVIVHKVLFSEPLTTSGVINFSFLLIAILINGAYGAFLFSRRRNGNNLVPFQLQMAFIISLYAIVVMIINLVTTGNEKPSKVFYTHLVAFSIFLIIELISFMALRNSDQIAEKEDDNFLKFDAFKDAFFNLYGQINLLPDDFGEIKTRMQKIKSDVDYMAMTNNPQARDKELILINRLTKMIGLIDSKQAGLKDALQEEISGFSIDFEQRKQIKSR